MRQIGYNSQRDNFSFAGKFPGWAQCFSTSAWMFMSYFEPTVRANDDEGLAAYVDDVEASVGDIGIGERIMGKIAPNVRTSTYWKVQHAAIQERLPDKKIALDLKFPVPQLPSLVSKGPVIIGTNKMGGLPGGHIILLVDTVPGDASFVANDPYGNARVKYMSKEGAGLFYPFAWLMEYIDYGGNTCRVIYAI